MKKITKITPTGNGKDVHLDVSVICDCGANTEESTFITEQEWERHHPDCPLNNQNNFIAYYTANLPCENCGQIDENDDIQCKCATIQFIDDIKYHAAEAEHNAEKAITLYKGKGTINDFINAENAAQDALNSILNLSKDFPSEHDTTEICATRAKRAIDTIQSLLIKRR